MAKEHKHKGVPATVVAVDSDVMPVDSVIVGDNRRLLGRRLGIFAFAIVVLFFAVNGYIQSAENGDALHAAQRKNAKLTRSVEKLSTTIRNQSELIKNLQEAIHIQNKILRQNGIRTVMVPGKDGTDGKVTYIYPTPIPTTTARPSPRPTSSSKPTKKPTHKPTHKPTPKPSPQPLDPVTDTICELTGICPLVLYSYFIF